jgi:S-adenosylmethionine:diacylglycerol 3-amino-3-carboxypropyl transferase
MPQNAPQSLPKPLFNFGTHNEDATVERLLLDALGTQEKRRLRVLSVAACGTHALTMCGSPDVERVDAVDVAGTQLELGALYRGAVESLSSVEEFAVFIGNSGEDSERAAMFPRVREHLGPKAGAYWDAHLDTVAAGVMHAGGAERCYSLVRDALPSSDLAELAKNPDAITAAFREGMTVAAMEELMVGMPRPAMEHMVEHGVPQIAAQANRRLAEVAGKAPDFIVELILRGSFPMEPIAARPRFLQPEIFAEIRQNGCGPDRLAFHEGPLQVVGPALAAEHGAYDFVDMSNILDMAPPDQAVPTIEGIKGAVRSGGSILCRAHKAPGSLAPLFEAAGLKVNTELSERAAAAESSFFIGDVCVATV